MMRWAGTFLGVFVFFLNSFGLAAPKERARRAPSPPPEAPSPEIPPIEELPKVAARLQSKNPDEVREAITLLTIMNTREAVAPLAALLRSGPPDAITDAAIDALARLGMPESIEVLSEMIRHRRAGVRRRAYAALASINDRRVIPLIEQGLRDSDRNVREACAEALGKLGAKNSLELLFLAFERGVLGASEAIGRLGGERDVNRFHTFLGKMPISVMLSGYEQFLRRNDLNESKKVEIINRLREVSGRLVCQSLLAYRDSLPPLGRGESPGELRRALSQAIDQVAWDEGRSRCRSLDPSLSGSGGGR
ncbi:MAG: HEAT repeat domain-containing protein [Deltaproteobacteria bacterium]|nr:HEAT repeat domain-containing protein [Deltaproteobacteria bacterium]